MAKGKKMYKYQIVSEQKQPYGHMLYLIRYKADNGAKSEKWIGQSMLKRYYEQDRLTGNLSEHVKGVVTATLKKSQGRTRGKHVLTPRMEGDGPVYSRPKQWGLADSFEVPKLNINIKSYCYSDPNGRWHVIMTDGQEDEDTYPTEKWAHQMVDMYNNPSEEDGEIT